MIRIARSLPGLALGALLLSAVAGCDEGTDWAKLEEPFPATDFTLPSLNGAPVTLSELRGRVVVMEFWATWCQPCRFSTPSLDRIYRQYQDRGVTVLLVNEGETPQAITQWVHGRFEAPIVLDQGMKLGQRYQVSGLPTLLVIDQHGRIVYAHSGYKGRLEHNLKLALDELLAERPDEMNGG